MKSHSIPSLLSIAAVLMAALVVAIVFGVATDSPTAQAQAQAQAADDDPNLINITSAAQLDAVRYDEDGDGEADSAGTDTEMYEAAFPEADRACATANPNTCEGYELMADVDLSGTDWAPIGIFENVFDGNGHTIDNLTIDTDGLLNVGLFSELFGAAVVRNLGLTGVSVTVTNDTADAVSVGGLAGMNAGTVSNSYAKGQITVTREQAFATSNAGGLVGNNTGAITASYAAVTVTASMSAPNAGGLVGNNSASVAASYATGAVSATASEDAAANAGGLVGSSSGTIMASYATGDAMATASGSAGDANAGGLVGSGSVAITASYSTGSATAAADTDDGGTANEGGLDGAGNATAVNSYWDTDSSGIRATTTAAGVPTSTVALQAPTGYGTSTNPADIFVDWNLPIGTTTPSDPWDFGGSWQYPVLKYGALKDVQQRSQVTLVLSATSTLEDDTVTVKATLDTASKQDTEVTLTVSEGASADKTTLTIPAGKTESNAATITPVDDNVVGKNDDVTIKGAVQSGGSGADNPSDVTLKIEDDESVEPDLVENVRVRVKETLAVVSWDALDGADGYTVEWTSRVSRGEANWSRSSSQEVSGTSTTVRRLRSGTEYAFRVSATNMANSDSEAVIASTEGEDDGASPFATMTPTPTATPAAPPATPIPPTSMVSTSTAATLRSGDGSVTLEFPAGSRSDPYQVNFESETGCTYPGAKADVTFTCVSVLIFDSEDMLETGVELDAPATITFRLTAEQVEALGGEFLLTKLHEMGGLLILTRPSAGAGVLTPATAGTRWTPLSGTTLTFDDETGGAVLQGWVSNFSSFTVVADQATYDTVQEMYGHLLPRDTLTPPTGGPSLPGVALLALLLGSVALLTAGWIMTARRSGA